MKVLFFLFFLLFKLNATNLKIASYNVENLFDMQNNGSEYKAYKPNTHKWTRVNFQKKLLNISEVICDINADIIGLQEIENGNVLKLLKRSLAKVGCSYKYHAITYKKKSAIQVAMLSKIPIRSSKDIIVNRKLKYRPILETKFIIENKVLYIFNNHWASKRSPESTRIVSARALKKRLLELPKNSEYILLGDFNSNYNEYKHLEKKHDDSRGRVGINHILQTVINKKLVKKNEMSQQKFSHYNLWLELVEFQRWSHNFYGKKQGLDAIILPSNMFDGIGVDYVNDSFEVFKPAYLFHKKGYIYRWQYKYNRHLGKGYSDHLPIVATFSTKAYKPHDNIGNIEEANISVLYKGLRASAYLKKAKVILKTKYHAIVKQSKDGRAIFVYGAGQLEEGGVYDILVYKLKTYKGLHEIVGFSVESKHAKKDIKYLYYKENLDFSNRNLENEVLEYIEGKYIKNKLYVKENVYPIYFKNRKSRPKDGTYLKLKKVQIGYHNRLQLVVWE